MSDTPFKDIPAGGWHSVEGHEARPAVVDRQIAALRQLKELLQMKLNANQREAEAVRLRITQLKQGGGS